MNNHWSLVEPAADNCVVEGPNLWGVFLACQNRLAQGLEWPLSEVQVGAEMRIVLKTLTLTVIVEMEIFSIS